MFNHTVLAQRSKTAMAYFARKRHGVNDDLTHLREAANWLLHAQDSTGGNGYAHSYHLIHGWQAPYPETTGYIIPTLLRANVHLNDDRILDSTKRAIAWLIKTQSPDGSFFDLQGRPQVFDAGQILIGLNYVFEYHPDLYQVKDALERTAQWLVSVQEDDGSFVKFAYNNRPHTYYSRVGSALIKAGKLLNDTVILNAGLKNIDWVIKQQQENGFFRHLSFDDSPPFLHTMVYVVEGLLDAFALTNETRYYESALKFSSRLLLEDEGTCALRSQYASDFTVKNPHICTTGLAQWAGICFVIEKINGDLRYKDSGFKNVHLVKQLHVFSKDHYIHGALPGSAPVYGNYLRMAFPNWGVKFFMDSIMEEMNA